MIEVYQDWLKSLKIGDKVIVDKGSLAFPLRYHIGAVTKVTATSQIQVDGREPKFKNGHIQGDRYSASKRICMPTDDLEEVVFREHMVHKLEHIKFKDLTTAQLKKIQQAIEE